MTTYELTKGALALDAAAAEPAKTDPATMSARFVISTTHPDRDGDVIEVRGINTAAHKSNPVVFFNHAKQLPFPVAVSQTPGGVYTVEIEDDRAYGTAYFKQNVAESVQIFHLVDAGLLRMASIGFIPVEMTPRTKNGRGMWHKKTELTEWSVVGVGANPHALRSELQKSLLAGSPVSDDLKRALEPYTADRAKAVANGVELPAEPGPMSEAEAVLDAAEEKAVSPPEEKATDPPADVDESTVIPDEPDPDPADAPPPAPVAKAQPLDEDEVLVSVTCPHAAFGGLDDARTWCRQKGYSTSVALACEDGWQFAQDESALEKLTDFRRVELEAGCTGLVAKVTATRIPKYVQKSRLSGCVKGGNLELTITSVLNDGCERVDDVLTIDLTKLFDHTANPDPEGVPDDPDAVYGAEPDWTPADKECMASLERTMQSNTDSIDSIRKTLYRLTGK